MIFKHITDWNPDEIDFEKIYETNWAISNYWINKLNDRNQVRGEMDEAIAGLQTILKVTGQSFDLSFFKNEMQAAKYYSELLKEYIFEEVRLNEFSDKPSRKNCMFLVPFEIDILEYGKKMNFDLTNKTMIEIETMEDAKIHFADITLLNCNNLIHDEKVEKAKEYWKGTELINLNTEILFRGHFKISMKK